MASTAVEDDWSSLTAWVSFAEEVGAELGAGGHGGARAELGDIPGGPVELGGSSGGSWCPGAAGRSRRRKPEVAEAVWAEEASMMLAEG